MALNNEGSLIHLKQQYYDLRMSTMDKLTNEVLDTVKELYKTQDVANITIAIEILKSKLK